jgi:molecular chaperone DnaK (HSP70)
LLQGSIVIHYGEGARTARTRVLGQFDLTGIPPAPRDVPRIEVTFSLDKDNVLTVRVCDLDTERQKAWLQRGAVTLVRAGDARKAPTREQAVQRAGVGA